jgi:2-polyprenyl-3-methyl-5-hydroxy-6-metoxy-1,4-benzoquinol methylase
MDVAQTYDDLADQYHLIFENRELSMERQAAALASILQLTCGLSSTARILDCACGIGTQSLGLAKLGFRVIGCDLSPMRSSVHAWRLLGETSRFSFQLPIC